MQRDLSEHHIQGELLLVAPEPQGLADLLGAAGHQVRWAADAEQAWSLALESQPELILLGLGVSAAFDLCRRIKQSAALSQVPVIFLAEPAAAAHPHQTSHAADDERAAALRAFALGGADVVAADAPHAELLARIGVHLNLGRAQRQLAAERGELERRAGARSAELEQLARTLEQEVQSRRAAEQFLRLSGQVFQATLDAIVITDAQGLIVTSNPAFTRITGYAAADVAGWFALRLASERTEEDVFGKMALEVSSSGHWSGEVQIRRKSGEACPGLLSVSTVVGPDGEAINYVAVFKDITERQAEQRLVKFLAYHDALTGLPNRQLTTERFELARAAAKRDGLRVVVMCLDLDRFKSINDSFGAAVGDKALQVVATFLGSCVREGDTVARHGGDEFQIILQDDAQFSAALATAQAILSGLRAGLVINGAPMTLSTSIGIAVCPGDGNELDDLLRHADTALHRAKEIGRDNYAFFTECMDRAVREKLAIHNQLRGAIARNEFVVHYQPQVELRGGAMVGAEALLRWDNNVLGKVPPDRFIPLAEEYGLITAIGEWVLGTVCAQIRRWHDAGLGDIKVAVNLSGRQFAQDRTVQFVETTLREHGIPPACLGIEITEGAVMGDPQKAVAALQRLKDIGVGISLDDFGTGYSSLSYLKRFPIDVLKIDKSFVDDVTSSTSDAAIALSVISLAHNLNMKVLAEGVETREQLAFLTEHGCDEMQGWYFSRALPADAFSALLREKKNLLSL
jgi:diguanylate cyclase (GGDEF)-like protein/PAS domain S-box-containing protein